VDFIFTGRRFWLSGIIVTELHLVTVRVTERVIFLGFHLPTEGKKWSSFWDARQVSTDNSLAISPLGRSRVRKVPVRQGKRTDTLPRLGGRLGST
jgi:hypothetical protein